MIGGAAILNPIDEWLRVLDAHAERERLRLERDSGLSKPLEHVARRMTGGEHHCIRRDFTAVREAHADDPLFPSSKLDGKPDHPRAELEPLAHGFQALPQGGHDLRQAIAADVRTRVAEHGLRRAVQRKSSITSRTLPRLCERVYSLPSL